MPNNYSKADLHRALSKAKIGLMTKQNSTFITTILFSLKQSWSTTVPTAATNGLYLLINADWFMGLTPPQRIGLLAHEAWHVAFQHMLRQGNRLPDLFNQAADHVINLMLLDKSYELPAGGLWDKKYTGMSTEQVYDLLEKQPPSSGNQGSMPGDIHIDPTATPEQTAAQEQKILDTIVRASTQSKLNGDEAGTIPGEIEVALDRLLNPKLPWHRILSNYMHALGAEDYSFRKPNRRYLPDFYLPGLYSEGLDNIACAFDVSGSVSDEEFAVEATEVDHIKQVLNPEWVHLVEFDTRIQGIHKLGRDDHVRDISFHGRGGTNLAPVFDHFNKKENRPKVLIVFSDLCCKAITQKPTYPVIWICINNPKAQVNFGKLIHLTIGG